MKGLVTGMKESFLDMKDFIFIKLGTLYEEQNKLAADVSRIRKIVKKSTGIANESFDVEGERVTFSLPLRSLAEFDYLEEQLNNLQVKKQLMKELTTFGGSDLKRVIHSIMNGMLDKHLAVQLSLQGKKKKKFAGTNLYNCVVGGYLLFSFFFTEMKCRYHCQQNKWYSQRRKIVRKPAV